MHFDREGHPVSCPPGAQVIWRVSVYACIRDKMSKIFLIVPHWSDVYELPGGVVEVTDMLENGLKRSVHLECGKHVILNSNRPMYVGESNFFDAETEQYCHSIYCVYDCRDARDPAWTVPFSEPEGREKKIKSASWVDVKDLTEDNLHPMHHQLLGYFGHGD